MKNVVMNSFLLIFSISLMAKDVEPMQQENEQKPIRLSYEAFVKILMMDMPNLKEVEKMAHDLYRLGEDKNFVVSEIQPSSEFDAFRAIAKKVEGEELLEAAGRCVFMNKGAHGMHLDPDLQGELASQLAKRIYPLTAYRIDTHFLSTQERAMFKSPCILVVERPATSEILLMQGAAKSVSKKSSSAAFAENFSVI